MCWPKSPPTGAQEEALLGKGEMGQILVCEAHVSGFSGFITEATEGFDHDIQINIMQTLVTQPFPAPKIYYYFF